MKKLLPLVLLAILSSGCAADAPTVPTCDCVAVCDPIKQACYCPTDSGMVDYTCELGACEDVCPDAWGCSTSGACACEGDASGPSCTPPSCDSCDGGFTCTSGVCRCDSDAMVCVQ